MENTYYMDNNYFSMRMDNKSKLNTFLILLLEQQKTMKIINKQVNNYTFMKTGK